MMTFGSALQDLKDGHKVAREGWNGKGMFIYLVKGSEIRAEQLKNEALQHVGYLQDTEDTLVKISSHIDMKAADGSITIGWNPSQIDMLADDWVLVAKNLE